MKENKKEQSVETKKIDATEVKRKTGGLKIRTKVRAGLKPVPANLR